MMNRRVWIWIEWTAVALALATLLVWLAQHWLFYTHASLWVDEIISIQAFSGLGVKESLTNYTSNNHMLFSFVNSILPGNDSFHPLRARFLSLLAVAAGVGIGLTFFLRRGWRLEALLFAIVAMGASPLLKLNLYARGYGLIFLASVVVFIALFRYLETGKRAYLILFSVAVFCGGWAVPSFLFFAGVLMLFLFAREAVQRKNWLAVGIAGAAVLAVTIVAYLPAIEYYRDEDAVAAMFGTERQYGRWGAILDTFNFYLTIRTEPTPRAFTSAAVLVILLGIGLPLARVRLKDPVWLTSGLSLLAVAAFFVICRGLGTPFVRTTAFIVVPTGLVIAFAVRNLLRAESPLRTGLTIGVAAFVLVGWVPQVRSLDLLPPASWRETVALAERVAPEIKRVHVKVRSQDYARLYLGEDYQSDDAFDEAAFLAGQQLLIDANYYAPPEDRFDATGLGDHVVQIDVPQERGEAIKSNWQRLAFVAPHGRGLEDLRAGPKEGAASGQTFQIDAKAGAPGVGMLYLNSLTPNLGKPPVLKILRESGSWKTLEPGGERFDGLWIWPVSIEPGTTFKISLYLSEPADEIPGFSIWSSPPLAKRPGIR